MKLTVKKCHKLATRFGTCMYDPITSIQTISVTTHTTTTVINHTS